MAQKIRGLLDFTSSLPGATFLQPEAHTKDKKILCGHRI
jgi:hypothetical protein